MHDRNTEKITEIIRQLICLKKGKGTMKGRRCVAVFCMTAMLLSVNEMGAGSWKQGELVAAAEDSVWKEVPENFAGRTDAVIAALHMQPKKLRIGGIKVKPVIGGSYSWAKLL